MCMCVQSKKLEKEKQYLQTDLLGSQNERNLLRESIQFHEHSLSELRTQVLCCKLQCAC